ncbi:MAG TPA: hypothetical protein VFE96_08130 [Candidatus Bathyarchaeia archaeon]|nr:hypothetical protein [Candidatus Bathyarchaeia archaeon]
MGLRIRIFTSASPAVALLIGFILVILGGIGEGIDFSQSGWSFVTIGLIVEVALPVARRLR